MSTQNQFMPDYAIHPGEILEETLEVRGIPKVEFARRCDISPKTVSQIISGQAPVMPEIALHFERVLGISSAIWTNLNAQYELHQARVAEAKALAAQHDWSKRFPVAAMANKGWIQKHKEKGEQAGELLNFFGMASISVWQNEFSAMQVAYRASNSFESKPHAVAAWLRKGELSASECHTAPYSEEAFKSALVEIRALTATRPNHFEPRMKELCAAAGVALVLVSELPGTRLSGAARWVNPHKAVIQLSLRHKSNDHFWFSFFHEAAHILKHAKKMLYLDDVNSGNTDLEEEANAYARNHLIPAKAYREFLKLPKCSATSVQRFARDIGVASGIVVGRLQHDKVIPFSYLNDLKQKFVLVENGD